MVQMTEEERFKSTIQEIKEIYLFLTEDKPTPDDEIKSREELINKIDILRTLDAFPELKIFLEEAKNKLEEWDTLELWFKEVVDLPQVILAIINFFDDDKEGRYEGTTRNQKIEPTSSTATQQVDVDQIVSQVSKQFLNKVEYSSSSSTCKTRM